MFDHPRGETHEENQYDLKAISEAISSAEIVL